MKKIKVGDSHITKIEISNFLQKTFNVEIHSSERNVKNYIFDISIDELEYFLKTLKNFKPNDDKTII